MLFGAVMLVAMQSAISGPWAQRATDGANGPACAQSVEHDGYYQTEYAARRRCDPAVAVVQ